PSDRVARRPSLHPVVAGAASGDPEPRGHRGGQGDAHAVERRGGRGGGDRRPGCRTRLRSGGDGATVSRQPLPARRAAPRMAGGGPRSGRRRPGGTSRDAPPGTGPGRQAVDVLLAAGALPVEVAVQLAASAEPDDAAAARTLRDASRALAGSDPSRAADLSLRALDLAGRDDPLRGTLAAETALLLHAAGRVTEGKQFADRILGEVLAPEQEGEVRLSIARMLALSADVRAEAGLRALALPGLPAPLRARHLATLVHNRLVGGRYEEARARVCEARQAVDPSGDANATFALDLAEAGLVSVTGDLGRALEMTEAASRNRRRA